MPRRSVFMVPVARNAAASTAQEKNGAGASDAEASIRSNVLLRRELVTQVRMVRFRAPSERARSCRRRSRAYW
jgi:hypothetical protein